VHSRRLGLARDLEAKGKGELGIGLLAALIPVLQGCDTCDENAPCGGGEVTLKQHAVVVLEQDWTRLGWGLWCFTVKVFGHQTESLQKFAFPMERKGGV